MKEKGKLIRIYQSDVHFPLLQDQDKDIQGAEIKSILTLKIWNLYLTVFKTTLQIILKMHSIIYGYI